MGADELSAEIHGFSEPDATPTPWAEGLEVLRAADTYWLSTVRPDGRPHVTPLIADPSDVSGCLPGLQS